MTSVKPLVHGYVRMEWPDETEIAEMCDDISAYCRVNGYQLGRVFVDRGVSDDVFARTGFIDLLGSVRLTQAHAVVVPSVDRLSPEAFVQDALKRMVEQANAKVLVIYETNGGSLPVEGGRDLGSGSLIVTGSISPEDRALIERTRKVNKTLSLFVFALQEHSNIPAESQIGIAEMLAALADTIRKRASQQAADSAVSIAAPAAPRSSGPTIHLAAAPERQGAPGESESINRRLSK